MEDVVLKDSTKGCHKCDMWWQDPTKVDVGKTTSHALWPDLMFGATLCSNGPGVHFIGESGLHRQFN